MQSLRLRLRLVLVLVLVLALAAPACGGDSQVVLELVGELGDADRVEVLLLEPVVLAKEQLHNALELAGASTETVFYMAERTRTTLMAADLQDREGPPRFEIRGAGGPYVPLVMTWAGEELLALGIYEPTRVFAAKLGIEHGPATVEAVSDVTIYPIQLEPVIRKLFATAAPQPVKPGEVMEVPCGATGALSGYVWRLADGHELRVLVALPEGDRLDRLEPPDLDCDQHSPGRAQITRGSVGDERDCDDTTFAVHAGARERCSRFDEDCNSETTQSLVPCGSACPANPVCLCDDGRVSSECVLAGQACTLPLMTSGEGKTPCPSSGPLLLPPVCQGGCEAMIAWVPDGLELTISDAPGGTAFGLGAWAKMEDDKAFLAARGTGPLSFALPPAVILRIRVDGNVESRVIALRTETDCGTTDQMVCQ
jgi:hypothetical protein